MLHTRRQLRRLIVGFDVLPCYVPGKHKNMQEATTTEVFLVVATITHHEMSKTAEDTARNVQHTARAITEYVGRVGEINTEMAERMAEVWVEGFRKQTELSQRMTRQFFDRSIEQAYNSEEFFGPGFPTWWAPYSYDPFGLWRTWARALWATYEIGRDAQQSEAQTAQQTARETQWTAAEETARVIETTAPKNGSVPIADYDEKTVGEIISQLDALSDEQLRRVKDYERRTKNRETLLQQIERRIQRAS
jgi:Asp-tRNA(Asn)/Glu-tRNA(Gln) amidotransferase C subunit